ncbi:hypothetical protein VTN77DRAFT_4671 [Rasamsonia byssochlamydoides]|uniref:uncharacterized protein n=1 Tax=Rasamsonia byssochlamydoides TaxID=89139 RepID=UPI0037429F7C
MPPIAGVANGAMVLQDTTILDMSLEVMNRVLRPKVDGSNHLNEIFSTDSLDFFVLFSSLATIFGNHGQSNYTTANMFLNGLVSQRRKRGLAGSVIAIGAIMGIGYMSREVSQAALQRIKQAGYVMMSEQDLHHLFAEGILAGRPESGPVSEIITGVRVVKPGEEVSTTWFTNPMFQHVILRQGGVNADKNETALAMPLKTQLLDVTSKEEAYEIIRGGSDRYPLILFANSSGTNLIFVRMLYPEIDGNSAARPSARARGRRRRTWCRFSSGSRDPIVVLERAHD